jgi:hypothetical protein
VLYTSDLWAFSNPDDKLLKQLFDIALLECDRWDGEVGANIGGGHMSFMGAVRLLNDGPLSTPRPRQVVFVHFGDNGPAGKGSSYDDWRTRVLSDLKRRGLEDVIPNSDIVIGYEGLTL